MRCVKCNMELPEGSRFCGRCGTPQPEERQGMPQMQPQTKYCCQCGKELPVDGRFCTYCGASQPEQGMQQPGPGAGNFHGGAGTPQPEQGMQQSGPGAGNFHGGAGAPQPEQGMQQPGPGAGNFQAGAGAPQPEQNMQQPDAVTGTFNAGAGAMPPHMGMPGPQQPFQESQKEQDKNKAILIGCIAGLGVLFIILIVMIVLFIGKGKKQDQAELEEMTGRQEEEIVREEEEEFSLPEEAEEPEPEEEPETVTEEESEPEQEQTAEGAYGKVDFNEISYVPEQQPYDVLSEDEMTAFDERIANMDIATDDSTDGIIYSVSAYRELETTVYYEPGTGGIRSVVTLEEQLAGAQVVRTVYLFQDGELLVVRTETFTGGSDPQYMNYYYFQKNCMIAEQTLFGGFDSAWTQMRMEMDSLDDSEREDFMEDEAEYYNRAYKVYDAVSQW